MPRPRDRRQRRAQVQYPVMPTLSRRQLLVRVGAVGTGLALALASQACQPSRPVPGPRPPTPPPQPTSPPSTTYFDTRLGAVEAYRAHGRADEVGVSWMRLVFAWNELQKNGLG